MISYKKDNEDYEKEISLLKAKLETNLETLRLVNEKKEDLVRMKEKLKSQIDSLQKEKSKFKRDIADVKLNLTEKHIKEQTVLKDKIYSLKKEKIKLVRDKKSLTHALSKQFKEMKAFKLRFIGQHVKENTMLKEKVGYLEKEKRELVTKLSEQQSDVSFRSNL